MKGQEDSIVVNDLGLGRIARLYKDGKLCKKIRLLIVICTSDHELYIQFVFIINYISPLGCNNLTTCHGMAYI